MNGLSAQCEPKVKIGGRAAVGQKAPQVLGFLDSHMWRLRSDSSKADQHVYMDTAC